MKVTKMRSQAARQRNQKLVSWAIHQLVFPAPLTFVNPFPRRLFRNWCSIFLGELRHKYNQKDAWPGHVNFHFLRDFWTKLCPKTVERRWKGDARCMLFLYQGFCDLPSSLPATPLRSTPLSAKIFFWEF